MTIAMGIIAGDGIVLAADREQSWSYLKTGASKISFVNRNGALCIAGSGVGGYIDSLAQELQEQFASKARAGVDSLRKIFRSTLTQFCADHAIQSGDVSLLIGIERDGKKALWSTYGSTLRRCEHYAVIGMGAEYASSVLSGIFDNPVVEAAAITTEVAKTITAFTTFEVKQHVQYCGKDTDIVIIKNGRAKQLNKPMSCLLESHFALYSNIRTLAMQYISGYPLKDPDHALEYLKGYLVNTRKNLMNATDIEVSDGGGPKLE